MVCEKNSNFGQSFLLILTTMLSFNRYYKLIGALSLIIGFGALASCDKSHGFKIHRLDTQLSRGEMPEDDPSFQAATLLFEISGYDYFDIFTLSEYSNKESITAHVEAVDSVFGSGLGQEEQAIGDAFYKLKKVFPDFKAPRVYSIISPFNQSVFVTDSIVFVGLNHYLGESYKYYNFFPSYLRRLKKRSRLPVDVVEAIIRVSMPLKSNAHVSTLERLIYDGAVTEALMQTLGVDEQSAIGLTDEQMDWLNENERNIWYSLIEKKLLYNTDLSVARSLLEPAPFTSVLSSETPGRAGKLTAHRLVKSYLNSHPELTYADLLQGKIAADAVFLSESRYNP